MKKLIFLSTAFVMLSIMTQAQTDSLSTVAKNDSLKLNLGDGTKLILVTEDDKLNVKFEDERDSLQRAENEIDDDFTYWAGIDLGFVGVNVTQGKGDDWFDIREQNSTAFSINPFEAKIPIFKHHLGINTGLGFTFQDYALPDTLQLVQVDDSISWNSSDPIRFEKNKLKTGYVKVPLLLEINTSKTKEKNFHFAAGLIGGWNFRSLIKQKFELNGDRSKNKTRGDYNVNPLLLEATVRFGYGGFNLFATAALTELFEDEKGPEVLPFTVGVTLVNF